MINIVINVIKLNVIENIGIYNVVKFKNNVNFELNVVLFVNFNVKLFVNVLFKIVWNIRFVIVNIIFVNNVFNNFGNLILIKIDWLNILLIFFNC